MTCKRCGTCCDKGPPALHREDAGLIGRGLTLADLLTLRKGEMAYDPVREVAEPLPQEVVRLASRFGSTACIHFHRDEHGLAACGVYAARPLECRLLDCEAPDALMAAYDQDRLTRAELLTGTPWANLVAEHEARCPVDRARELAERVRAAGSAGDSEAGRELAEMLGYDRTLRSVISEKNPSLANILAFLLGRPLESLLPPQG